MNWKEKECDWVENDRRVRVKVIGCTCIACRFSEELPDCEINPREPEITHMCWKHDKRVQAYQDPCNDFQ